MSELGLQKSFSSATKDPGALWLSPSDVSEALAGVELDGEQAYLLAQLRLLATNEQQYSPAILNGAILGFCSTFDELLADHACEESLRKDGFSPLTTESLVLAMARPGSVLGVKDTEYMALLLQRINEYCEINRDLLLSDLVLISEMAAEEYEEAKQGAAA